MRGKRMVKTICVLVILLGITTTRPTKADESSDKLEKVVSQLPRGRLGIPIYWFEMKSIMGWEKMMLVLGYADNRSICIHTKTIAKNESPDRSFRCRPAN
jgi:hypothetical protein